MEAMENQSSLPAFTNGNNISGLDTDEGRAAVSGYILVALLVAIVLAHVVQVVTTDDDSAFHLGADNRTSENTSTDGDVSSEGALLVDISSSDGLLGSLEAKADVLVPTGSFALGNDAFIVEEDGFLLLEASVVLK